MHEHSYIQAIIKDVKDKDDVIRLVLELGELVGIDSSHLKEHLVDETGWDIEIVEKKALVRCTCSHVGAPLIRERLHDLVVYECPKCGHIAPLAVDGENIRILKVVYRNDED